jgi:hypothetical protein
MHYFGWFERFLDAAAERGVQFVNLADEANALAGQQVPVAELVQGRVDGRSGTMAVQGAEEIRLPR